MHFHSLDRLARNLLDLQQIINALTEKGAAIRFHKENLFFSGEGNPLQKLQLHMMGAFTEFERSLIRERQREGVAIAQKKGVRLGWSKALFDEQVSEIRIRVGKGEKNKAGALGFFPFRVC